MLFFILWFQPGIFYAQTPKEYQIKAVFLFNFTQFVEWPASAFNNDTDPLVIGIIGKDPFERFIDQAVEGEKKESHPLEIRRYRDVGDIGNCHIIFINSGDANDVGKVLSTLNNRSVLTVSDAQNFAASGGMVRFFTHENKIRLQINLRAARAAGLTISSKLLRVADVIDD